MYELILLVVFAGIAFRTASLSDEDPEAIPRKISDKMGKLWDIAHQGMRENRFLRAEKALLTILKIDQKNAAAYNRLGILYAKQKEYKDAIDCFEIASSIEPTASSLHNLGLIYYETENYQKAATAFEQALKLEEELAARHIAYAKVQEKLGNSKLMLQGLERAVELEPNPESYALLIKAYEALGMAAEADILKDKLEKLILPSGKPKKVLRAKRVVI
ncbi:MAG TPA: tetratricopeptide repeat protein [Candidatus Limnocylindria bacterium]|nr:tetratricopeptide repeat protein [Candidatus Limnocylindria bacterium]